MTFFSVIPDCVTGISGLHTAAEKLKSLMAPKQTQQSLLRALLISDDSMVLRTPPSLPYLSRNTEARFFKKYNAYKPITGFAQESIKHYTETQTGTLMSNSGQNSGLLPWRNPNCQEPTISHIALVDRSRGCYPLGRSHQ